MNEGRCPSCGHENPEDAGSCASCGKALHAATESEKAQAYAKNDEGVRLLREGDLDRAVAAFTEAIALHSRFETAYRNRAEALQRLGRHREASIDLTRSQEPRGVAQRPSPGDRPHSGFKRAFIWTAAPVVALSFISLGGGLGTVDSPSGLLNLLWFVAAAIWLGALLLAFVAALAIPSRRQQASGALAGVGVGLLPLSLTYFANLSAPV